MIDKQVFFKEVVAELEILKELTKEDTEAYLEAKRIEREQKEYQTHLLVHERLINKINEIKIFNTEYAELAVSILNNDLHRVIKKVVQSEVDYKETTRCRNHYENLPIEMKNELYQRIEERIKRADAWHIHMYINHMKTDLALTIIPEEHKTFIEHLKLIALACLKSYILENEYRAYLPEALPSVLWLIERAEAVNLLAFSLFEYPQVLSNHETEDKVKDLLKQWYNEKGKYITSIENLLEHEIKLGEYKSGRRLFSRYHYLFDETFAKEKEVTLLEMLYKEYEKCMAIENNMKREQALFGIRNELLKFEDVVPPNPVSVS